MQCDARGLVARFDMSQLRSLNTTSKEAIRIKLDEQEEQRKCVVCLDRQKNVAFIACGHMCCCQQCSATVHCCPVCRSDITQRTTIFL